MSNAHNVTSSVVRNVACDVAQNVARNVQFATNAICNTRNLEHVQLPTRATCNKCNLQHMQHMQLATHATCNIHNAMWKNSPMGYVITMAKILRIWKHT